VLDGKGTGGGTVLAASFVEDIGDVSVDGAGADAQRIGNLLVGSPPGNQA
jgi:hypothetical protein